MLEPLWSPNPSQKTLLQDFMKKTGHDDVHTLYDWSIENIPDFWREVYDFCGVIGDFKGPVFEEDKHFKDAKWFENTTLNFAENLLKRRDDTPALIFKGEDKITQTLTFNELYNAVSKARQYFQNAGLQKGDRVAALMPNMPETVITMLAATSLGAIFTACSPDFGTPAILDRFTQVEPTLLIACSGYFYGGKSFSCAEKIDALQQKLTTLKQTLIVPYGNINADQHHKLFHEALNDYQAQDIAFEKFSFNHPLYIVYSSGTTGVPKCIVHRTGGVLLQHMKEHQLHSNIRKDDRLFYFTTCGWMMWHWLISGLASGATLVLYDGNPFHPSPLALWHMAEDLKINHFGTSAKYIDALHKAHVCPSKEANLSHLRTLFSTGSPLAPENFDYVYENIKKDICLSSISGGTDLLSCFMLGSADLPVYKGQIQMRGLGMAVDIFDENGKSTLKGELVCKKPFPSQPLGFWHDEQDKRYKSTYFERFEGVWHHGDYAEITPQKGIIMYGRSDATLNPSGVRIGTAEIYALVEYFDDILESLATGKPTKDHDEEIILFVRMREGITLNDDLIQKMKKYIRTQASPRHVPKFIFEAPDFPRTKNGKLAELAVKNIFKGRDTTNENALLNPEALEFFKNMAKEK